MTDFYHANKDMILKVENTFHVGTEQTPLNFMVQLKNLDMTHLPYEFNMNDMARKEILNEDLVFTKIFCYLFFVISWVSWINWFY